MYLSLKFLTPWGSLLLATSLLPSPHKTDSPLSPLPPPTLSLKVNSVTKGLTWNVEFNPFTTHTHILLDIFLTCSSLQLDSPSPFYLLFSIITNIPSVLPAASWCPLDSSGSSQAQPTLPRNHLASCQTNHADPEGVASWQHRST